MLVPADSLFAHLLFSWPSILTKLPLLGLLLEERYPAPHPGIFASQLCIQSSLDSKRLLSAWRKAEILLTFRPTWLFCGDPLDIGQGGEAFAIRTEEVRTRNEDEVSFLHRTRGPCRSGVSEDREHMGGAA